MEPAEGDILYTREGERFGIAALVPSAVRLCISQRMMAFRMQPTQNSAYVMWQINCQHAYAQAAADLIGAAAPHVNVERIKNLWMVLPPRREQDEIVAAVKALHSRPDETIARAHKEIALLREYRTRLIADVVTGKLDVREAAATAAGGRRERAGAARRSGRCERWRSNDDADSRVGRGGRSLTCRIRQPSRRSTTSSMWTGWRRSSPTVTLWCDAEMVARPARAPPSA